MAKLYFSEFDQTFAYELYIALDEMKKRGLSECKVYPAILVNNVDHFYCKAFDLVLDKFPVGHFCGEKCDEYKPRNGKSGCCKHWGFCYTPGDEMILKRDGKLVKIKDL
jgi:hypothetical protein